MTAPMYLFLLTASCCSSAAEIHHLEQEDCCDHPDHCRHVLDAAGQQFQCGIADEAQRQTVGDRIREWHDQCSDDGRHAFSRVVPIDVSQFAQHQTSHEEQY